MNIDKMRQSIIDYCGNDVFDSSYLIDKFGSNNQLLQATVYNMYIKRELIKKSDGFMWLDKTKIKELQ